VVPADYYWTKAEEALQRADAQTLLNNYFVSVAVAYSLLARSEARFRSRRPRALSREGARIPEPAAPDVVLDGATAP